MNESPTLYGQVLTTLDPLDLKQALLDVGVAARIGESSHYVGGQYVAVEDQRAELRFEKLDDEYLIHGDGDIVDELLFVAVFFSDALSKLRLQHRLEIYFPSDNQMFYLHYNWP